MRSFERSNKKDHLVWAIVNDSRMHEECNPHTNLTRGNNKGDIGRSRHINKCQKDSNKCKIRKSEHNG